MAGILTFSDFIGGPDSIQLEMIFPSTQRTYQYNFNTDITGWTWHIDHQTLVASPMAYDRYTGAPNFAASQVIGYFPKADIAVDSSVIQVVDAALGLVNITIPGNLYAGPLIPDARSKAPVTIVGITWTTNETPSQVNTHRWAFMQCYEPGVTIGDPTLSTTLLYTAFNVA